MKSGISFEHSKASIRPQDDFFRHHNGAWLDAYEIPADRASDGAFITLRDLAEVQVREIIESSTGSDEAQKIGDLYKSFMDTAAIAKRGIEPLQSHLAAVDAVTTLQDFITLMARLEKQGIGGVWDSGIIPDTDDSTRHIFIMGQGGISLPDEAYYRDEQYKEIRAKFVDHVNAMAVLAKTPEIDGARILALETEIALHHWDKEKSREISNINNRMTQSEVLAQYSDCHLALWMQEIGLPADLGTLLVAQPSFFEAMSTLLTSFDARLDEWKAWLKWNIVTSSASYLTDDIVNESFSFFGTALTGAPELRERWKRAVAFTQGALGEAIGKIYVGQHFPASSKSQMLELVDNLIESYRLSINEITWMSEATKARALDKLSKFTPKIGYPDKWRDYSALVIDKDDLLGNIQRINAFQHAYELDKLSKPVDKAEWHMTPQTVNAYYNPFGNEIVFPAAILQTPFFNPDVDLAVNYGAIGSVIGHEIGHGFDDQGSQFDGDGNVSNWWTDDDRAAFEKQTAKLVEQYNELSPVSTPDMKVNGAFTLGENIGDLGGCAISFKAYKIALGGKEAPVIDGLTGDQRFFYSYAQAWRGKNRPEETRRRNATDPHSPNEFRCNQILRNIPEFYAAFGVTESDAMWLDPSERVRIW
jgi:putative endopeptidase